jgi:hypothetical protein
MTADREKRYSSTPWSLNPLAKNFQYPLNRRLDGPFSWYRCFEKEKNFLCLPEIKPQLVQPET